MSRSRQILIGRRDVNDNVTQSPKSNDSTWKRTVPTPLKPTNLNSKKFSTTPSSTNTPQKSTSKESKIDLLSPQSKLLFEELPGLVADLKKDAKKRQQQQQQQQKSNSIKPIKINFNNIENNQKLSLNEETNFLLSTPRNNINNSKLNSISNDNEEKFKSTRLKEQCLLKEFKESFEKSSKFNYY